MLDWFKTVHYDKMTSEEVEQMYREQDRKSARFWGRVESVWQFIYGTFLVLVRLACIAGVIALIVFPFYKPMLLGAYAVMAVIYGIPLYFGIKEYNRREREAQEKANEWVRKNL